MWIMKLPLSTSWRPAKSSFKRTAVVLMVAFLLSPALSHAGTISFTCDANVNSLGPATLCNAFNTTVANLYSSTFTNANASVYIQFGNTGLGASSQYLEAVSYSTYRSFLGFDATDARDASAVASLPAVEPSPFTGKNIILTGALGDALGIGDIVGNTATGAFCSTPGSPGCYNGLITIATPTIVAGYGATYYYENGVHLPNSIDIFTVAEHEVNEILGTISCGGTSGSSIVDLCGSAYASAADLFRYNGAGSRVGYISTPAYFSSDGGVTSVAPYNYLANGADYGDFSTSCQHVQDAFGCIGPTLNILNDGRPEVAILDTIGYTITPTPEPASLVLVGTSLVMLARLRRQRS